MTDKKFSKLLEQLHEELGKTKAVDEKGRELLRDLNTDIKKLLEQRGHEETKGSMLKRFQDAIDHFEVTHPDLTSELSRIMTILSNAGI